MLFAVELVNLLHVDLRATGMSESNCGLMFWKVIFSGSGHFSLLNNISWSAQNSGFTWMSLEKGIAKEQKVMEKEVRAVDGQQSFNPKTLAFELLNRSSFYECVLYVRTFHTFSSCIKRPNVTDGFGRNSTGTSNTYRIIGFWLYLWPFLSIHSSHICVWMHI